MSRINWAQVPSSYEQGIDRGVLYSSSGPEAWNGIVSITERDSSELSSRYFDGVRVQGSTRPGDYSANTECYTYPILLDDFPNDIYGFSYRTAKGSENYRVHLVYNASFSIAGKNYKQKDPSLFAFSIDAKPIFFPPNKPISRLIIDSEFTPPMILEILEDILYGLEGSEARLPLPTEVLDIFESNYTLRVTDNLDGTFTITGPDEMIQMLDATTFSITSDSAIYLDGDTYQISSY